MRRVKLPVHSLTGIAAVLFCILGESNLLSAETAASARTPEQERQTFRFADPNLLIELVASEPHVDSPVAIAWDEFGAMYVAEMPGYPQTKGVGRIRRLVDANADGFFETATTFAGSLDFPTSILPYRGGIFLTAAPDILYLKDIDGDGVADEKRVVLTGFNPGNQQLLVNGLYWGLDNWVYGANGRSDGSIRRPDQPAEEATSLRTQDFRFHPQTLAFEPLPGQSQFGAARDDWGNRFLSWNTIPIRHALLPTAAIRRSPELATTAVVDLAPLDDSQQIYPISQPPKQFNAERADSYNALCGLTILRGDLLGNEYLGNAFVGESLTNLAIRRVLEPAGPSFVARNVHQRREFFASSDSWCHPVNFATGPDGALYMVDFYRQFVEHPDWVAPGLRDQVDWQAGRGHGRIWRIRTKDRPVTMERRSLNLVSAKSSQLVDELAHPVGWRRDTAQRLIVENKRGDAKSALLKLLHHKSPLVRLQAMWTLDGIDQLPNSIAVTLLKDKDEHVRAAALQLIAGRLAAMHGPPPELIALGNDPSELVRFHYAVALGELPGEQSGRALAGLLTGFPDDRWLHLAVVSSSKAMPAEVARALRTTSSEQIWTNPSERQFDVLVQLMQNLAAQATEQEVGEVRSWLSGLSTIDAGPGHLAAADGLWKNPSKNAQASVPESISAAAIRFATDSHATMNVRFAAIQVLSRMQQPTGSLDSLSGLIGGVEPTALQSAAATAIVKLVSTNHISRLLDAWGTLPLSVRQTVLRQLAQSPAAGLLLDRVERGSIAVTEFDDASRIALSNHSDHNVRERAGRLLAAVETSDRAEVLAKYQAALPMAGQRERGAKVFSTQCVTCHSIHGRGNRVGPDLTGAASRTKETLLVDVFDPSRQVSPDFLAYTVLTVDGETVVGLLAAESGRAITLRNAEGIERTIERAAVEQFKASGKSLMPDGLEQKISLQDAADLLEFLHKPDRDLIELPR